jgi:hypothetical protein
VARWQLKNFILPIFFVFSYQIVNGPSSQLLSKSSLAF